MPWLRGGMSQEEGRLDAALGNMEDMTRDSRKPFLNEKQELPKECWTINVGGCQGLWRLISVIEGLDRDFRPSLVHVQETSCESYQWIAIEKYLKKIGYKAFHTTGTLDSRPTSGAWKRGIITMVSDQLRTRWLGGHSWRNGQFHAIEVQDVMCINSYVAPSEESISVHLGELQTFMEQIKWEGLWLAGGDWNEVSFDSLTSSFAKLYNGEVQDLELINTSRWDSNKVIDFWFGNCDLGAAHGRLEKISDHLVVTTAVCFHNLADMAYTRFAQYRQFKCPEWISMKKWAELFNLAYEQGGKEDWFSSRTMVEKMEWDAEADVQQIIDYQWAEVCARLTWTLARASCFSLNYIPLEYDNLKEIKLIVSNANAVAIKGVSIRTQNRKLQKKAERSCEAMRKLYKKAGRLEELKRRLTRNEKGVETCNLIKKLFKDTLCSDVQLQMVNEELEKVGTKIKQIEIKEKNDKISSWRTKMKTNMKAKGMWINKQGQTLSPTVQSHKTAQTNAEAVEMIYEYWKDFWESQNWSEEERISCSEEIADFVRGKTNGRTFEGGRPSLDEFCAGLRRISGTHGIDGWSSQELKVISYSKKAASLLWDTMALWEEENVIPQCLGCCKLTCVPKKDARFLAPNQYRPICVMSSLWRAWSSTWIRAGAVQEWISAVFPLEVAGGIPGSIGAEVLAAVVDHQLNVAKFGASLDFKHAFDTVDLKMMRAALVQVLPPSLANWMQLLFEQWCNMDRWIVHDGCVHLQSIKTDTGLPQGDPAAPLVMNILIAVCMAKVNAECEDPSLLNVTYMDDRTLVSNSKENVEKAVKAWEVQAGKFHLLENSQKAQYAQVSRGQSMEVLGALVGRPTKPKMDASGPVQRLDKADDKYRRVSFLPLNFKLKLKTANSFIKSGLAYGWLSNQPTTKQLKKQEIALCRCLGRTKYTSPFMRNVLIGAHSHLSLQVLRKQIRILAKRNQVMNEMGMEIQGSPLEKMVSSSLRCLGWKVEGEVWSHHVFQEGFKIAEMLDNVLWAKVSHQLRESYRFEEFAKLKNCGRHDAICIGDLPYDEKRRKLALRWAGANFTAVMLVLGGIASPLQRAMHGWNRTTLYCPVCCAEAPD